MAATRAKTYKFDIGGHELKVQIKFGDWHTPWIYDYYRYYEPKEAAGHMLSKTEVEDLILKVYGGDTDAYLLAMPTVDNDAVELEKRKNSGTLRKIQQLN